MLKLYFIKDNDIVYIDGPFNRVAINHKLVVADGNVIADNVVMDGFEYDEIRIVNTEVSL